MPPGQAVPSGLEASAGQSGLLPVQASAWSQGPAAARQMLVLLLNWSAGQRALAPEQFSLTSQGPAAGRQIAPALTGQQMPSLAAPTAQLQA